MPLPAVRPHIVELFWPRSGHMPHGMMAIGRCASVLGNKLAIPHVKGVHHLGHFRFISRPHLAYSNHICFKIFGPHLLFQSDNARSNVDCNSRTCQCLASRHRLKHSHQYDYIDMMGVMNKYMSPRSAPTGGCWDGGEAEVLAAILTHVRGKGVNLGNFFCLNRWPNKVGVYYRWLWSMSHDWSSAARVGCLN